jgi:transcriptional regulator with XRE-family HTH domain
MSKSVQITPAAAKWRWNDRPAILEATKALGLNDRRVAGLLGVSAEAVHSWANGRRQIPQLRLLTLIFLVGRLTGAFGKQQPPQTRYARRAKMAIDAADAWKNLASLELLEDVDGVDLTETNPELVKKAGLLGEAAVAKLERADAA